MHARPAVARAARAALLAAALGPLASLAAADELGIVPGKRIGPLGRDGGEADLIAAYGSEAVRGVDIDLGEGERTAGTLLFPDDPRRRVEIVWHDTAGRRRPAQGTLRGSSTLWRLPGGVTLGLTVEEVEGLNGGPFKLAGFAWDGGGVVLSWEGGALAEALAENTVVFFDVGAAASQRPEFLEVQGDRPFDSFSPALRALAPTVGRIVVRFEQP